MPNIKKQSTSLRLTDAPEQFGAHTETSMMSQVEDSLSADSDANVNDKDFCAGAEVFERFWLQPSDYAGQKIKLRLRLNRKFGGWKVKDELIKALGLRVGNSINTEVSVLLGPGIIDDNGDTDLFADGEAAKWLIDTVLNDEKNRGVVEGRIIDCVVKLAYCLAPVGDNNKQVNKVTLVLLRGICSRGIEEGFDLNPFSSSKKWAHIIASL